MATQKPEDANLSTDQFADMNRRFYASSSSPHGFIRQRVRAVLVAGSRDDHVLEAQKGLRLGKFVAGFPEDDPLLDPTSVNSFVMTESVVLFHHAAESLIRLVLAHIDGPACPWLEMRRLTFNRYHSDKDRAPRNPGHGRNPPVTHGRLLRHRECRQREPSRDRGELAGP